MLPTRDAFCAAVVADKINTQGNFTPSRFSWNRHFSPGSHKDRKFEFPSNSAESAFRELPKTRRVGLEIPSSESKSLCWQDSSGFDWNWVKPKKFSSWEDGFESENITVIETEARNGRRFFGEKSWTFFRKSVSLRHFISIKSILYTYLCDVMQLMMLSRSFYKSKYSEGYA